MSRKSIVASLDIGTSNTRVIVGEISEDRNVNIIGIGRSESLGLRKGTIVDLDNTVRSIREAIEQAERMVGMNIDSVYVGVSSAHVQVMKNRGVVAVSSEDKEITRQDYDRVLDGAGVVAMPPELEIIEIVPTNFIVDGYDGIKDPIGMIGVRLEVDALIMMCKSTILKNLTKCVERAGLDIRGLVVNNLASANVALNEDEKELGAVLIDIGGGTTEISVFQHGALAKKSVIPIGGGHISSDISQGLKVSLAEGEKIKLKYGTTIYPEGTSNKFEVTTVGKKTEEISADSLIGIIEPRVQEIFYMVNKELLEMGLEDELPGGVVLTGGVASLEGIDSIAQVQLGNSVRIYQPEFIGVADPTYTTGVGIIQQSMENVDDSVPVSKGNGAVTSIKDKIKDLFNDFFG
ncbi:cell division protein FtsA [Proteinivorax hydrogeniformans]|uniref:Cell division protein FtsA n=1 Tax=Proteinivorax hydrogeniformans TaxID=1826727 RepID=A0AAU8HPQ1_9FIRM